MTDANEKYHPRYELEKIEDPAKNLHTGSSFQSFLDEQGIVIESPSVVPDRLSGVEKYKDALSIAVDSLRKIQSGLTTVESMVEMRTKSLATETLNEIYGLVGVTLTAGDESSKLSEALANWEHFADLSKERFQRIQELEWEVERTEQIYRMNRTHVEQSKERIQALEAEEKKMLARLHRQSNIMADIEAENATLRANGLRVGEITITPHPHGYWLTQDGGEGMLVPTEKFVKMIVDYYKDNF